MADMRYSLTGPMIITSRLMPGIRIGDATISIELEFMHADSDQYTYFIDGSDGLHYSAGDLRTNPYEGEGTDGIVRALSSLLSFLLAEAERYSGSGQMGAATPDDGWAFNPAVAEWAYLNSDEIASAQIELSGEAF